MTDAAVGSCLRKLRAVFPREVALTKGEVAIWVERLHAVPDDVGVAATDRWVDCGRTFPTVADFLAACRDEAARRAPSTRLEPFVPPTAAQRASIAKHLGHARERLAAGGAALDRRLKSADAD